MNWSLTQPQFGDMIRVKCGNIWHYGIYVSDEEVIQFGPPPVPGRIPEGKDIAVMAADVDSFLCGGFLEVAQPDRKEKKRRYPASRTVALARESLGKTGYHILYNNCEHFAYMCMFGEPACQQVDAVRSFFRNFPVLEVYTVPIPEDVVPETVYPAQRQQEISACSHRRVQAEKYGVWKLLAFAAGRTFGKKMEELSFQKLESGKWICQNFCFSLSHCSGLGAVAVSRKPVGVDVEWVDRLRNKGLADKILSPEEREIYGRLAEDRKARWLTEKWTQKESAFKRRGGIGFSPAKVDTAGTVSLHLQKEGREYVLSVAGEDLQRLRLHALSWEEIV